MFANMEININHIKQAESIFIDGNTFNKERMEFITNLNTIDLLAVPGSGKTTALIAKLYCIAKQLPMKYNSGILVLAHTNNAVEEIEKQLKHLCPQLFSYPNFIGTVQSFANRFIANQACYSLYGSYIKKNDNEISERELVSKFRQIKRGTALSGYIFNQLYSQYSKITIKSLRDGLNLEFSESKKIITNLKKQKVLQANGACNYSLVKDISSSNSDNILAFVRKIHDLAIKEVRSQANTFCLRYKVDLIHKKFRSYSGDLGFNSTSGAELLSYFEEMFKSGVLRYSDSFSLAKYYISIQKDLCKILQNRFKYVFIDEMQDLDQEQIDLIENIFFHSETKTIIQRIGDKNQSIFSSGKYVSADVIWKTRNEMNPIKYPQNLSLNISYRLTTIIAKLVDGFVLNRDEGYKVVGVEKDIIIPPYLLIYDNENDRQALENKFIDIIKEYNLNKNLKNIKNGFHIIGWTTDKDYGSEKWYLKKIFPEYSKENKQKKDDFDCLQKYLFLFDSEKKTLESIRKSLLNGIIRILRIEGVYFDYEKGKHFSKSLFLGRIKSLESDYLKEFNLKIYNWCFSIITKRNYEDIYQEYLDFITNDLNTIIPEFSIKQSKTFITTDFSFSNLIDYESKRNKTEQDIEIKLSSIHGVKGQTHCATMYLETEYYNFETEKLNVKVKEETKKKSAEYANNPLYFQEQNFSGLDGFAKAKETLKMMYVGFSRPTHLLCFAVKRENVKHDIKKYKDSGWQIIEYLE